MGFKKFIIWGVLLICAGLLQCKKVEQNNYNYLTYAPGLQVYKGDSCVHGDTTLLPGAVFYFKIGANSNFGSKNALRRFSIRKLSLIANDTTPNDTAFNNRLIFDTIIPPNNMAFGPILFRDTVIDTIGTEQYILVAEDNHLQRDSNTILINANKPDVLLDIINQTELIYSKSKDEKAYYDLIENIYVRYAQGHRADLVYYAREENKPAQIESGNRNYTNFVKIDPPLEFPTYGKIQRAYNNGTSSLFTPSIGEQYVAKIRNKEYFVLLDIKDVDFECNGECVSKVKIEYRKASTILTDSLFNK